jgi:TonB dependent receptor-like, beta-barrel
MRRLIVITLLLIAINARGGETTAVVTGVVTAAGVPVPHWQVRSDETSTETNERGEYRLLVTPGRHFVSSGQASARFDIAAGETARFDLTLGVIDEFSLRQDFTDPEHAMADVPLTRDDLSHLPLGRTLDIFPRLLPDALRDGFDPAFIDGVEPATRPAQLPLEFLGAVNMLTIGLPAEYGHTTSDLLLATTYSRHDTIGSVFAYWQPRSVATHNEVTGSRHWDAGFTVGRPLTGRLWFFLGYSRLTDDFDRSGFAPVRVHDSVDAFLGKLELTATRSSTITVEGFGDPGKASFEFSGGRGSFRTGAATGVLRGTSNGSNWTAEGTLANTSMSDLFFNPHSTRINAGVQRMFASHVLRAGAEYDREPGLLGFVGSVPPPPIARHNGTAAYVEDAWRATSNLAVNAGLRGEFGGHDRLLPRASIAWGPRSDLRLFATYGQYGDDLLYGSLVIPRRMHEASAGGELRHHVFRFSARALHRSLEGKTLNGGLLEASEDLTPLRFRVSYLLSSFDRGYASIFIPRRHQVTGYASVAGRVAELGTIVTWSSSAPLRPSNESAPALFRTDLHLGVHLGHISVVADVMNLFDKQTPTNFLIFFPPSDGVHDEPLGWEEPRAIRFGIRATL